LLAALGLCAREFAGHTAPRAIFMTASRSGGDHFGVLRTFMTRAFATSGIRSRQHWSRLALVSSQTVRRLSHASNTQHAAPIVQAALARATLAEKQMRDLVRASATYCQRRLDRTGAELP
jgi:hypothetical protein